MEPSPLRIDADGLQAAAGGRAGVRSDSAGEAATCDPQIRERCFLFRRYSLQYTCDVFSVQLDMSNQARQLVGAEFALHILSFKQRQVAQLLLLTLPFPKLQTHLFAIESVSALQPMIRDFFRCRKYNVTSSTPAS